jgi:DUF4097 and DUF4098 domain-containing protein YvlB
MTSKLVATAVAITLTSIAAPAAAQVYPERIASLNSRRDRDRGWADRQQGRQEQTERTTRTVRIGATGELDVANVSGDILITRGQGQDAVIEIVKTARAQTAEDARALLGLVQVEVNERAGRAEVRTRYPSGDEMRNQNRRNVNVSVTYTIAAPAGARVTARSVSGSVAARDLQGELVLETVSGGVTIINGKRVVSAKSISGNVEVTGADTDGGIVASSVSGTVAVRKAKARSLSLETVSGNVVLEEVAAERAELKTVSGNATFSGPLAAGGRYVLTSHSGNVRVTLNGDTGFELEASSFSGSVRSDFPLTGSNGNRGRRQTVRGVFGNGSAVLDLTTFSGSIIVAKQ